MNIISSDDLAYKSDANNIKDNSDGVIGQPAHPQ